MRRAERALARLYALVAHARDRVDQQRLEHLLLRDGRQDVRHAAREHGLADARRSDQQDAEATGGRDREPALGDLLPRDVREVGDDGRAPACPHDLNRLADIIDAPSELRERLHEPSRDLAVGMRGKGAPRTDERHAEALGELTVRHEATHRHDLALQ